MFEFTFASIMASMVASGIGFVFWKYGRKQSRSPFVIIGAVLFVVSYLITDITLLLSVTAGLSAILYLLVKHGF